MCEFAWIANITTENVRAIFRFLLLLLLLAIFINDEHDGDYIFGFDNHVDDDNTNRQRQPTDISACVRVKFVYCCNAGHYIYIAFLWRY